VIQDQANEKLLKKGAESAEQRHLEGRWARAAGVVSLLWALFVLYTGGRGPFPSVENAAIFLGFGFVLAFMLYGGSARAPKDRPAWGDLVLLVVGAGTCIYAAVNWERLVNVVSNATRLDLVISAILILLALEMTRRVIGISMPIVALVMVAYALWGNFVPGVFSHRGFHFTDILESLFFGTTGMWGTVSGIIGTNVAIFVVFGSVLFHTGGGETFKDVALFLAGRHTGGAGKVSTLGSALFGMISGSAAANAATVGNFTIGMMKRLGYTPELAAAIEAVASTGGQIMPPIMGAAAFVMSEVIHVPYAKIAIAATIPALLYYLGAGAAVHFEAKRLGLKAVPAEMIPRLSDFLSWRRAAPLFVPVAVMITMLLKDYTPSTAGFWATACAILLYIFSNFDLAGIRERFVKMLLSLEQAGKSLAMLAVLGVSADIIIGMFGMTGLGVKISSELIDLSGGHLFIALLLTAFVCTILGMGVTTTADYVLAASVIGPALVNMGLPQLTAHLFIFYFAASSALTPPVCAAVFVTAGLANANWLKTAFKACIIGIAAFFVPFVLAYSPSLMMQGPVLTILVNALTAGLGTVVLAAAIAGYFINPAKLWERLLLGASAILLIWPDFMISAAGLGLLALVYVANRAPRSQPEATAAD
jgi:TRAP transporter 4TM/12TM fusion protein